MSKPSGIAGVAAHSHVGDGHVGTSSNGGGGADGLLACGLAFDFGEDDDDDVEDDQKLTLVVKVRCCCCRRRVGSDDVDDDTDGDEVAAARWPRARRGAALAIECIMSLWISDVRIRLFANITPSVYSLLCRDSDEMLGVYQKGGGWRRNRQHLTQAEPRSTSPIKQKEREKKNWDYCHQSYGYPVR